MKLILLLSVISGTGSYRPGALVDLPEDEAKDLLKLKAAVPFDAVQVSKAADPKPVGHPTAPVAEPSVGGEEEVLSKSEYTEIKEKLLKIKGVTPAIVDGLIENGFQSAEDIALADVESFKGVKGITPKMAKIISSSASQMAEESDGGSNLTE